MKKKIINVEIEQGIGTSQKILMALGVAAAVIAIAGFGAAVASGLVSLKKSLPTVGRNNTAPNVGNIKTPVVDNKISKAVVAETVYTCTNIPDQLKKVYGEMDPQFQQKIYNMTAEAYAAISQSYNTYKTTGAYPNLQDKINQEVKAITGKYQLSEVEQEIYSKIYAKAASDMTTPEILPANYYKDLVESLINQQLTAIQSTSNQQKIAACVADYLRAIANRIAITAELVGNSATDKLYTGLTNEAVYNELLGVYEETLYYENLIRQLPPTESFVAEVNKQLAAAGYQPVSSSDIFVEYLLAAVYNYSNYIYWYGGRVVDAGEAYLSVDKYLDQAIISSQTLLSMAVETTNSLEKYRSQYPIYSYNNIIEQKALNVAAAKLVGTGNGVDFSMSDYASKLQNKNNSTTTTTNSVSASAATATSSSMSVAEACTEVDKWAAKCGNYLTNSNGSSLSTADKYICNNFYDVLLSMQTICDNGAEVTWTCDQALNKAKEVCGNLDLMKIEDSSGVVLGAAKANRCTALTKSNYEIKYLKNFFGDNTVKLLTSKNNANDLMMRMVSNVVKLEETQQTVQNNPNYIWLAGLITTLENTKATVTINDYKALVAMFAELAKNSSTATITKEIPLYLPDSGNTTTKTVTKTVRITEEELRNLVSYMPFVAAVMTYTKENKLSIENSGELKALYEKYNSLESGNNLSMQNITDNAIAFYEKYEAQLKKFYEPLAVAHSSFVQYEVDSTNAGENYYNNYGYCKFNGQVEDYNTVDYADYDFSGSYNPLAMVSVAHAARNLVTGDSFIAKSFVAEKALVEFGDKLVKPLKEAQGAIDLLLKSSTVKSNADELMQVFNEVLKQLNIN